MCLTNFSVAEGRTAGSGVRRAPSVRHSGTGQLLLFWASIEEGELIPKLTQFRNSTVLRKSLVLPLNLVY